MKTGRELLAIFTVQLALISPTAFGGIFPDTLRRTAGMAPDTSLLKEHIDILSDDAMQGRETGTEGEKKAYQYITREFRSIGLLPKGDKGYVQPFPFNAGSYMGPANTLSIGNKSLKAGEQFYPLAYSANKNFTGKTIVCRLWNTCSGQG
jgi:hypothetical protein